MSQDPAVPGPADAEFVTVAEAARRLGIDPRQVRRYAQRLPEEDRTQDRTRTKRGSPVLLVRLAVIQAIREGNDVQASVDSKGQGQDKDRTGQDSMSGELIAELRARLADKDTEIVRLAAMAERAQESERLALAALREEQSRTAVLLAAREMKQVGPAAQDAPMDAQEPQSGAGGSAEGNAAQSEKRPWWRLWGGR